MKNIILQLMRNMQTKAIIIWPRAHPIDNTIGEDVLRTFSETSAIERKEAL